jgi:hypothetical protein
MRELCPRHQGEWQKYVADHGNETKNTVLEH